MRDVPEAIHTVLQTRAASRNQSLQHYLSDELRRLAERPTIDEVLARIERDLPMERYPTLSLLARGYELRADVTAYDASYVALAEYLRCPLVTADTRLAGASGIRCPVRLVTRPA